MGKFFKGFKKFSDKIGMVTTIGGLILIPFFGAAAAGALAAGTATNGAVLTSFWAPLVTDPVTGSVGLVEGVTRIFNGWAGLAMSGFDVIASPISAAFNGQSVGAALSGAWSAPAAALAPAAVS